jgi:hypothetical protein
LIRALQELPGDPEVGWLGEDQEHPDNIEEVYLLIGGYGQFGDRYVTIPEMMAVLSPEKGVLP